MDPGKRNPGFSIIICQTSKNTDPVSCVLGFDPVSGVLWLDPFSCVLGLDPFSGVFGSGPVSSQNSNNLNTSLLL